MDLTCVQAAFEKKGYTFRYFDTAAEAADYLDGAIVGKTVGFGDSQTLKTLGLYERLCRRNTVYSPMHLREDQTFYTEAEKTIHTEVFLVSVNGAAESGELVNIDGFGNRVAGSLYCHQQVYFVFGVNKLAPTLEEALWRARNIAAPRNVQRLGKRTPCAVRADRCYDCNSPDRICNGVLLHLHKMSRVRAEIVLIGEELGL